MKALSWLAYLILVELMVQHIHAIQYSDVFSTPLHHFISQETSVPIHTCNTTQSDHHTCTISIEPHWHNLELTKNRSNQFGGKWILAGSITFKKKCNALVPLREILLQWHGSHLENLQASLFLVKHQETFKPINENHVADGQWSSAKQMLTLSFDHPLSLQSSTILNLVLTVPESQEPLMKGHFTIVPECLPKPFQEAATKDPLAIAIDVMHCIIE